MATKNKAVVEIIEGVLVYAKIAEAGKKYQSDDTEYSVGIIVDEDTADEWEDSFKKQPARKIKATEFEDKFNIPLPERFKGEKNVFQITLKKDCIVDGKEMFPDFRPKVMLETEDEIVDITTSRLVANGSVGKVSYRVSENAYGRFARLQNILIQEEDFIEYESSGSGEAGSEFGVSKKVKKEPENKAATEARKRKEEAAEEEKDKPVEKPTKAKPTKKVSKPEPEDDSDESLDDSPF